MSFSPIDVKDILQPCATIAAAVIAGVFLIAVSKCRPMKATIEVNGSQVQLEGNASEIADVIRGLGRSGSGRPAGRSVAPGKGRRGARSKYDDAGKRAIVAEAAKLKRGGMPAFLKSKAISYATLGNWRTKFKKGK